MQQRVFDLLAQVDRSPARPAGGLGVGLTLARTLVELHGGEIAAHSEGQDRGSELVVRVPVGVPVRPGRSDEGRRGPVPARRVLLVEDDEIVRRALHRILVVDGHRVDVARDGPEGVDVALATVPEVALVDIGLPGIDGYEVGRRIRAELGRRVLLVALTGYGQEQDQRRAIEAGFDVHLVKPVTYGDLVRLLGSAGRPDA